MFKFITRLCRQPIVLAALIAASPGYSQPAVSVPMSSAPIPDAPHTLGEGPAIQDARISANVDAALDLLVEVAYDPTLPPDVRSRALATLTLMDNKKRAGRLKWGCIGTAGGTQFNELYSPPGPNPPTFELLDPNDTSNVVGLDKSLPRLGPGVIASILVHEATHCTQRWSGRKIPPEDESEQKKSIGRLETPAYCAELDFINARLDQLAGSTDPEDVAERKRLEDRKGKVVAPTKNVVKRWRDS